VCPEYGRITHTGKWERAVGEFLASPVDDAACEHGREVVDVLAAAIAREVEEGHNTGGHVGAGIVFGGSPPRRRTADSGETFATRVRGPMRSTCDWSERSSSTE
jgi:hypothetical protein